ncbi:MAG: hypothetical protein R6X02_23145 [Enhygromyxa sp.]
MLGMSPNTERDYRLTLSEASLLDGNPDDLPELVVLRTTDRRHLFLPLDDN